ASTASASSSRSTTPTASPTATQCASSPTPSFSPTTKSTPDMARLLVRSGATVPELFDREIFLKQISPSRYELWVGTPSGEETPIAANSQIGGVEGLEDL